MRPFIATFTTALTLCAALVCAPIAAHAQSAADSPAQGVIVKDFDVYVDLPTNFVFIKLPQGWKFVGSVAPDAVDHLPATVHTWLLPAETDDAVRMARPSQQAARSPRS